MKKFSIILAAVLSLAVTVFAAACNNDGNKNDSGNVTEGGGIITENPPEQPDNSNLGSTLIVYFSATGSTEKVAGYIAEATGGQLFELLPVKPYSGSDLSWTTPGSRVNLEHDDESLRDIELQSTAVDKWETYDRIFVSYPIWWGIAAWPVNNFIKSNDFTGKTVIPFATSASSPLGQSGTLLAEMAGTGNWLAGQRFPSGVSKSTVSSWVNGIDK